MLNQKRHLDYEEDDDEDDLGHEIKVSEDKEEERKIEWDISVWSRCSQTCGPNGKQVGFGEKRVPRGRKLR